MWLGLGLTWTRLDLCRLPQMKKALGSGLHVQMSQLLEYP